MITFSQLGKQGRLGNQLWQIAATVAAAKKYNTNYEFPNWEYESFFNLHGCFNPLLKINKVFQEPHFHYSPIPYSGGDLDLSGYYQSYKYFEGFDSFIKNIFEFGFKVDRNLGTTSLHIRRGDYVTIGNDFHTNQTEDYYRQAMELAPSEKYMIFSDDIAWCKSKFIGPQFIFAQDNSPAVDLALMANCDHNIIANSSFSWWAAFLNKNVDKKIVSPKTWFGPKLPHDTKDLRPESWIVI